MSRFRTKTKRETVISTASLPDIVFLLLFFFMISAVIKPPLEEVDPEIPKARNLTKAEMKTLVKELVVGYPKKGTSNVPKISANDRLIELSGVTQWVNQVRNELPEAHKNQMIIKLKADINVDMGLINDIQQELRKANARKIIYETLQDV